MANPNIGTEIITKGVRLTVIVEYSCDNIIAVFLAHNGKEYRGVLLESDQGFFPHGIPFTNKPVVELKMCSKGSSRSALDIKSGSENKPPGAGDTGDVKVEQSALVSRFSYNTNPFLFNPRPVPEIPIVEMKTIGARRKTVRDIRLRPRQTLCSKCKSAIHENHKNHYSSSNPHINMNSMLSNQIPVTSSDVVGSHCNTSTSLGLRKRKSSFQTPMVLLEDIQRKCSKQTTDRNSKAASTSCTTTNHGSRKGVTRSNSNNRLSELVDRKNISVKARYNRSSSSGSSNSHTNNGGTDWLQIIDNSENKRSTINSRNCKKEKLSCSTFNPKPSPAIKITIGDGDILKIPPRLPDRDTLFNEDHIPVPKIKILELPVSSDNQSHKKAKKAAKRSKERDRAKNVAKEDFNGDFKVDEIVPYKTQKKHKKKHRHRHESPVHISENLNEHSLRHSVDVKKGNELYVDQFPDNNQEENDVDWTNEVTKTDEENHENTFPIQENVSHNRPRLVYTWKQNQGLSRVASSPKHTTPAVSPKYIVKTSPSIMPIGSSPHRRKNASPARVVSASPNWHFTSSPNRLLKDYPLRSKSSSTYSSGLSSESVPPAEYSMVQSTDDSQSHSSGLDSNLSDFSDDSGQERMPDDFFPGTNSPAREEEDKGMIKPLMMKIQTQNVSGCMLEEGREIRVGDIVWGKIQGFPWWPGRVSNITVTQRDNDVVITQLAKVAWFGSNTMSHMHCSDLFPFLKDFKVRYNKKKKGQYRVAIKQATVAAQLVATEADRDFVFEDFDLL